MNRKTRTFIVLIVAVVVAGAASYGVYRTIRRMPVREVEVAHVYAVTAAHELEPGALVSANDVKVVAWPERGVVPGAFTSADAVVGRGVTERILENEPVTESKLAPTASGAGLPPTITPGMRAISIRVNEVIGVAGFVVPGTHVDVLVTLKQNDDSLTRVVVSNAQVLTAGAKYDQDKSKDPEPIQSSVVTLLLTPDDAERVVLASNDGQIMLALRNPMDVATTNTSGTRTAALLGEPAVVVPPAPHITRPKPVAKVVAPAPAPAAPQPYTVEAIRGAARSQETVR